MGFRFNRAHRDDNHADVVAALVAAGAWVQDLSSVGAGCPDLIAKYRGHLYWIEVKNRESKNGRYYRHDGMTSAQVEWAARYGPDGPIIQIVHDAAEALAAIGASKEAV